MPYNILSTALGLNKFIKQQQYVSKRLVQGRIYGRCLIANIKEDWK
jgi:hypothetical protein